MRIKLRKRKKKWKKWKVKKPKVSKCFGTKNMEKKKSLWKCVEIDGECDGRWCKSWIRKLIGMKYENVYTTHIDIIPTLTYTCFHTRKLNERKWMNSYKLITEQNDFTRREETLKMCNKTFTYCKTNYFLTTIQHNFYGLTVYTYNTAIYTDRYVATWMFDEHKKNFRWK